MTVSSDHIPFYQDIFDLDGFLRDPVLLFGVEDCYVRRKKFLDCLFRPKRFLRTQTGDWMRLRARKLLFGVKGGARRRRVPAIPANFREKTLQDILARYGLRDILTLDFFDNRADVIHDMNLPLPGSFRGRFATVIDIGNLEHVFDTRQCMWNLFQSVKLGGRLFMETPCKGYFNHGLHTFSPECIVQAFEINGFEIEYLRYSTPAGLEVERPDMIPDAVLFLAAVKRKEHEAFVVPQQGYWKDIYGKAR